MSFKDRPMTSGAAAAAISIEDIHAVATSHDPVKVQKERLRSMKSELEGRHAEQRGSEFAPLIREIDRVMKTLDAADDEQMPRLDTARK